MEQTGRDARLSADQRRRFERLDRRVGRVAIEQGLAEATHDPGAAEREGCLGEEAAGLPETALASVWQRVVLPDGDRVEGEGHESVHAFAGVSREAHLEGTEAALHAAADAIGVLSKILARPGHRRRVDAVDGGAHRLPEAVAPGLDAGALAPFEIGDRVALDAR